MKMVLVNVDLTLFQGDTDLYEESRRLVFVCVTILLPSLFLSSAEFLNFCDGCLVRGPPFGENESF